MIGRKNCEEFSLNSPLSALHPFSLFTSVYPKDRGFFSMLKFSPLGTDFAFINDINNYNFNKLPTLREMARKLLLIHSKGEGDHWMRWE